MARNYYAVLGVPRDADEKTIRKAYRKLARQYHPDLNPNNPEAEQKFKEISEAHRVLSDPETRKLYDRFGDQWEQVQRAGVGPEDAAQGRQGAGPGGQRTYTRTVTPEEFEQMFGDRGGFGGFGGSAGFTDIFDSFFDEGRPTGFGADQRRRTRPRRGRDIETTVQVTLEEAYRGTSRTLDKDGRRLEVQIPPGVRSGSRVRVSGEGTPGSDGAGDLYLTVEVLPHERFRREGDDLHVMVPVDLTTAVLGGEIHVPTLDRPVLLTIPPGTQNGKAFRLRGLGMPALRNPDRRGDLYAAVTVQLPTHLSPQQRRLFEQLRELEREPA